MIELADSAAHVFVADLATVELDEADRHHLARVLRLRSGERVSVSDGGGGWRWARWTGDGLEPDGDPHTVAPRFRSVGVGVALVKGDRLDWTVEKLTELGVDRIVPVVTARCVVKWAPGKADAQVARLRRIARSAAMQSRRVRLPDVAALTPLADLMAEPGVVRADLYGTWLGDAVPTPAMVVVGPEGGWDATERELHPASLRLADHVLRTETAAVSAAVGLVERRRRAERVDPA